MSSSTRVPQTISLFNSYINTTDEHLQSSRGSMPVYEALDLTSVQADGWNSRRVHWRDTLYPKWSSPDTKTPTVNLEVSNFMKEFSEYSRPLLNKMAASENAIEQDELIFNFKITRKSPTHPTTPIEEQCFTTLNNLGGAELKAASRTKNDSSRPSVAEGADGVQYAWVVGTIPPTDPDDGTVKEFSSGSTHIFNVGMEHQRKNFYLFTRWYNSKYPQFAGPWTTVMDVVIA